MLLDFDLLEQVAARILAVVSCLRISEMDNVVSVSYSQAKGERGIISQLYRYSCQGVQNTDPTNVFGVGSYRLSVDAEARPSANISCKIHQVHL